MAAAAAAEPKQPQQQQPPRKWIGRRVGFRWGKPHRTAPNEPDRPSDGQPIAATAATGEQGKEEEEEADQEVRPVVVAEQGSIEGTAAPPTVAPPAKAKSASSSLFSSLVLAAAPKRRKANNIIPAGSGGGGGVVEERSGASVGIAEEGGTPGPEGRRRGGGGGGVGFQLLTRFLTVLGGKRAHRTAAKTGKEFLPTEGLKYVSRPSRGPYENKEHSSPHLFYPFVLDPFPISRVIAPSLSRCDQASHTIRTFLSFFFCLRTPKHD